MNPRYQIFVSSTFKDLKEVRERVIFELMRNGFIAVGMEQFHASDEEQMEYIRPLIDQTDYYVVIVKGRYGSLASDGMSYTEKEYRYALEKGVPVLAFLYEDIGSLSVKDTDNNPESLKKFNSFCEELSSRRIVSFWKSEDDLVTKVKDAVYAMTFRKPAIGWIRGDQALDPQVYKDLEAARKKNDELSKLLGDLSGDCIVFSDQVSHGSDMFCFDAELKPTKNNGDGAVDATEIVPFQISWDNLFLLLIENILKEDFESKVHQLLGAYFANKISSEVSGEYHFILNMDVVITIRTQLQALGLITTYAREKSSGTAKSVCWRITEKGRKYISQLKAIGRNS